MGRQKHTGAKPPRSFHISHSEWATIIKTIGLSPRETDVIKLILMGCTDKQIATSLGMSVNTVRTHLRHAFLRLGLSGRMELAMYIFGLIHLPHHQNG